MKDIGLARGSVQLQPHSKAWAILFKKESVSIKEALGSVIVEHVGSTAIPTVPAKPIVDIAIPYSRQDEAMRWIEPLHDLGFEYKGEEGVPGRFFFVKGPEKNRTVYLHVVDKEEFRRLVRFRDALIKDGVLATEYSDLKQQLAKQYADDRKSYTHEKAKFIERVLGV